LRSGAAGFFRKDTSVEEFVEGVLEVLQGHYVVGRNLVERVLVSLGTREADNRPRTDRLSNAERIILGLLGQAYSVRSIAAARGISQKTVRNHIASVYRKLEVRNRTEAILWAVRTGLAPQV
jgi:DNA-binding NarL/FixJ family response regulator